MFFSCTLLPKQYVYKCEKYVTQHGGYVQWASSCLSLLLFKTEGRRVKKMLCNKNLPFQSLIKSEEGTNMAVNAGVSRYKQ